MQPPPRTGEARAEQLAGGRCCHLLGMRRLVRDGLVDRRDMVGLGRLGLARGHDRRRNQGSRWHNESQRGDQAFERGCHERVLRQGVRICRRVNSRGELLALID
jgi:hypothetical protein